MLIVDLITLNLVRDLFRISMAEAGLKNDKKERSTPLSERPCPTTQDPKSQTMSLENVTEQGLYPAYWRGVQLFLGPGWCDN
jgi:hypothetical protein